MASQSVQTHWDICVVGDVDKVSSYLVNTGNDHRGRREEEQKHKQGWEGGRGYHNVMCV